MLVEWFYPGGVSDDPVCATGNLGSQVAISGCCHDLRCGGGDVQVENDNLRCYALHRHFDPVVADGRPGPRIAVHGGCSSDDGVTPSHVLGGQFRQVVDSS